MNTYLAIAVGGAFGAMSRYWISQSVPRFDGSGFPLGTFTVNLVGSFLIGVLFILFVEKLQVAEQWSPFVYCWVFGCHDNFFNFFTRCVIVVSAR